jgi:hypothetical protein
MSAPPSGVLTENYKGILQEYCHTRNLGNPSYEVTQHGTPNEPAWNVTIRYGQSVYTTPNPVHGAKRIAEQTAAKQALEAVEARQEAFLAGKPLEQEAIIAELTEAHGEADTEDLADSTEASSTEPLDVPIELLIAALGIANHHLKDSQRRPRGRSASESNQSVFAKDLADLTMTIVREVTQAAAENQIRFADSKSEESLSG